MAPLSCLQAYRFEASGAIFLMPSCSSAEIGSVEEALAILRKHKQGGKKEKKAKKAKKEKKEKKEKKKKKKEKGKKAESSSSSD